MNSHKPSAVQVCSVEDIPTDGRALIVRLGPSDVGLYRTDGEIFAVKNSCPHRGAKMCQGQPLTGTMLPSAPDQYIWGHEGRVLRCPWHHWEFDIATGETMFGVDRRKLVTYEVLVEEDRVLLVPGAAEMRALRSAPAQGAGVESGDER